jgi:antitoxin component YwqK of YwqJK toxin-antitoxin module
LLNCLPFWNGSGIIKREGGWMGKIIANFLAKVSILAFFVLVSIFSFVFSQEEQVKRNYTYWQGKKILYNETFYANGKKARFIRYSLDGSIDLEVVYDENEKELKSKSYLEGVLHEDISYKDGKREHSLRYYPNGNLDNEVFYKDGEPDGTSKSYYDNGVLQAENKYKEGKRYLLRFYNKIGDLETVTYFDEQGVVPTKIEEYQNGKIVKTLDQQDIQSRMRKKAESMMREKSR